MKVSLNTIKQFTSVDMTVDKLVAKLNRQLGKVDAVIDLSARYDAAVIVKIVSCEKHSNADKLNVCQVDDGSGELAQVVCGAPNVRAEMYAVWLKPGATVPSTADDDEPFVLGARELRGVISNGMLASPKELGLGDSHDGILEITDNDLHDGEALTIGRSFGETFGMNDTIIDIENKMFTHRPDLFGQLGVAREIAGISGKRFESPGWYTNTPQFADATGIDLTTFNDAGDGVPRIVFVPMSDITVTASPIWLQCALVALGGKPINNVVDVTNYIMLLTAQPTHAYDYDKLRGSKIGARMANQGETIKLLNGRTYDLNASDIVIADNEGPIGLGGIMGGGESEVSDTTTNIVIEVATFDMYMVRKSSMTHGVFTDALTRFNKGQSPLQNNVILAHLMKMIENIATGRQAGAVSDLLSGQYADTSERDRDAISVSTEFINARLGLNMSTQEIDTLLTNVEISTGSDESVNTFSLRQPFWRTDLELPEDIVEEVGRLYGFDKLPRELPKRTILPAPKNETLSAIRQVRHALATAGANEVLTYSFVHERLLERTGQAKAHAYRLSNALSPDLQYYRLGLTPSLLDKVTMNRKAGYDKFALFEIGKSHFKGEYDKEEPTKPNEGTHIGFVIAYSDKQMPTGAAYYHACRYLEEVINLSEHSLVPMTGFDMTKDEWGRQLTSSYEPSRSALIVIEGQIWGVVGEYRKQVRQAFKLPAFVAGFEIHADILKFDATKYRPLSKYPKVSQDVSLRVSTDMPHSALITAAQSVIDQLDKGYEAFIVTTAIYQPEDATSKTITLRLTITHHERTLSDAEIRPTVESIAKQAAEDCGAMMI